jgi:hypothetical protein
MNAKPSRITLPHRLGISIVTVGISACSGHTSDDASTPQDAVSDVATPDVAGDGAVCQVVMPGRTCFSTCQVLSMGVHWEPCEVYCPTDPNMLYCFTASGEPSPDGCMLSHFQDGGVYVFC